MIPVSATGWSVKGEKTKQVQAGKSNITATLAVPMLQGPSFCQLIFGGKTSAALPHGPVEHNVHLNFTESHWQSTESMFSFVQFLEKVLNPTDEQRPWILLLDCASVHTASAFSQQLHSQLPWVKSIYIPGGSTAYNQPLDRSMMKSFKSAIARKASRHFAEQILLVDSLDLSARFLKPVIATWVHEVINDISSRRDIFQTAWAHILPKNPEDAASILEEPAPQDPLTLAPLEQPPVTIGEEPVPESELPAPVLEDRNLSVLERCITLRLVYGRGYS